MCDLQDFLHHSRPGLQSCYQILMTAGKILQTSGIVEIVSRLAE